MKRFWLFRSNLKSLESYHEFKDLRSFIKNCHDYYMLLPLWLLQANDVDEVTIWRLTDIKRDPIEFDINGKKYIQRWVTHFNKTLKFPAPTISFWRGGFKEYDQITKSHPKHFGYKIYLGAGQRINSRWGGKYDLFLMEDDKDLKSNPHTHPFYKTASPFIFHPRSDSIKPIWDICWPCNFTQLKYKGQEFFIKAIANNPNLQKLNIAHCGNRPNIGKKLCKKYNVTNIKFHGHLDKKQLNDLLNDSKFGLNVSNRRDGCPRVSTEILMSGTPLIIHNQTRLLSYYKKRGVVQIDDSNISKKIINAIVNYQQYRDEVAKALQDELHFDRTSKKNIAVWNSLAKI